MKLTREQELSLENKRLKQIISDLLYALQTITEGLDSKHSQVIIAKEAITKAIANYQKDRNHPL